VDSCCFAIILTTNHFQNPSCVFQYFVSVVSGKTVLPAYELDPSCDGGNLKYYELPSMFQHILKGELIQVNRTYWEPFITILHKRIRSISLSTFDTFTLIQREWLQSELKKEGLAIGGLLFTSLKDGNTAEAFHARCDGKGATLTAIEDNNGHFFGGFASESWSSRGVWTSCESVWLFTQDSDGTLKRIDIKSNDRKRSIYCYRDYGPIFGAGYDILINPRGQSSCRESSFESGVLAETNICGVPAETNFTINQYEVYEVVKFVL